MIHTLPRLPFPHKCEQLSLLWAAVPRKAGGGGGGGSVFGESELPIGTALVALGALLGLLLSVLQHGYRLNERAWLRGTVVRCHILGLGGRGWSVAPPDLGHRGAFWHPYRPIVRTQKKTPSQPHRCMDSALT
jgi:hypothetical protein